MTLRLRELEPALWPDVERLFGPNGACGGCWCMFWRLRPGERFADVKGPRAKRRFRALVRAGEALGLVAYDGGEPVGWVTYGPRLSFPKLARARTLACADPERVWSVPCFYVKAGHRGEGVAAALLAAALRAMRRRGARVAEGYPVRPRPGGGRTPAAFAYTGMLPMFRGAGFREAGPGGRWRARVRRFLGAGGRSAGTARPRRGRRS